MAKSVSKADLIDAVAASSDMTKKDVKTVVDTMLEQVSSHLKQGDKVRLTCVHNIWVLAHFTCRAKKACLT